MAWDPKDPPRFSGLKIDGVPPFQGSIEFTFDRKVNVLIGPNATGKSTILKVLYPEFRELYDLQHLELQGLELQLELKGAGLDVRLPKLDQPAPQGEWNPLFAGDWLKHDKIPYSDEPHPRRGAVNQGTVPLIYLPPIRDVAPPFVADYDSDHLRPENRHKTSFDRVGAPLWMEFGEEYEHSTHGVSELEAQLAWLAQDPERFIGQEKRIAEFRNMSRGYAPHLPLDAEPFTSFDCNRVYYALQRLRDDDKSGEGSGVDTARVLAVTYACLRDICPEVIQGEPASIFTPKMLVDEATYHDLYVPGLPSELAVDYVERPGMGAHTVDNKGEPLYWGVLSTGTQGLFWWICYLALKMAWHYLFYVSDRRLYDGPDNQLPTWQHLPAILLIDEIENHLHPTWQRRVIPALRKHFPGLQIFATTHSPFVVAGLKRGQVHRLYRERGVIKTDKLTEEEKEHKLVGWTVEEILRKFMDVTDPTDEATATAAATLRWLRGRYPSNGEVTAVQWVQECIQQLQDNPERTRDEEYAWHWLKAKQSGIAADDATPGLEWRDAALDELRDIVSPDLEAGGPLAAQQELFITQLRDLLADDEIDSHDPDEEV